MSANHPQVTVCSRPIADTGSASQSQRMALDDLKGVVVASGTWLYDGAIPERTDVIARNYDPTWAGYSADGLVEDGELGPAAGPDGLYYYVSGTGPFFTAVDAKEWAERAWGPIRWDD